MIALGILLLIASSFGLGVLVTLVAVWTLWWSDPAEVRLYNGATYSVETVTHTATGGPATATYARFVPGHDDVTGRPYGSTVYPFTDDDDAGNALDPKHG